MTSSFTEFQSIGLKFDKSYIHGISQVSRQASAGSDSYLFHARNSFSSRMSALTHRPSVPNSKVPDYKDYVNFVSAYKKTGDGKPNSATSYSNFLEKTKHQKFAAVKPPVLNKDDVDGNTQKKTVKTEIFLQINNDDKKENPKVKGIDATKKKLEEVTSKNNYDQSDRNQLVRVNNLEKNEKATFVVNLTKPATTDFDSNERHLLRGNKLEENEKATIVASTKSITMFSPPPPPPMPKEFPKTQIKSWKPIQAPALKKANDIKHENVKLNENLVKKLAYGAMLDMYRASHEKANNYVATLPKNQVKRENGLQKIIENIAAHGGLDKLTGRSNPQTETET